MSQPFDRIQREAELRELFAVVKGEQPADLAITHLKIVDVYAGDVYEGALLIHRGRIAAIQPNDAVVSLAKKHFDGRGLYAAPGLIDGHMHIDTELVTPKVLSEVISPFGTTTVVAEFLDLCSASGQRALENAKIFFQKRDALPFRLYLEAPAKKVDPKVVRQLLEWDGVFALGEFNHYKYCAGTPDTFEQLLDAQANHKMQLSHARWAKEEQEFNLFPAAGSVAGHDAFEMEDLMMDLRAGHLTMIRQGYGVLQNVSRLMPQIIARGLPTDHIGVCTDGLALEYMMEAGHMDAIVQTVMDMGLDPIQAIRLATLNIAQGLHLEHEIGSLTPGRRADLILFEDLHQIRKPKYVFKDGRLVAQNGTLLAKLDGFDYSPLRGNRGQGLTGLTLAEMETQFLKASADGTQCLVRVFNEAVPGEYNWYEDLWMDVEADDIRLPDDASYLWVIQRYPSGKRHVVSTFTKDYFVRAGGFAITNQSPAPYIAVVGRNRADMLLAAQEVDRYPGGYAVYIDGAKRGSLQLPLAGVVSDLGADAFSAEARNLKRLGEENGFTDPMGWFRQLMMLFWKLDRHGWLTV